MNKAEYPQYLIIWLLLAAIPTYRVLTAPTRSAGLVMGYCFQLWMFYWLGAALHALPWSDLPNDDFVIVGFKESVVGFAGFVIGSTISPLVARLFAKPAKLPRASSSKLALHYAVVGGLIAFVFRPILGNIPSATALLSAGQQFALAGVCVGCWQAWERGEKAKLLKWLGPVSLMPAVTVIGQGFLGFGVLALAAVVCFIAQFVRPRWALLLWLAILGYGGISFFTAYMRDRGMIRAVVWTNQSFSARLDRFQRTLATVEPFSLWNQSQLERIDDRLNQNGLVGAAVVNLTANQDYAKGETLWMAVLAMIPRAIWPDKPISAGSGDLVTRFTGIVFADGTSVGVGSVMELYANFGTSGEFWGFVILGMLVGLADIRAADYLHAGHWHQFAVWFAVGLAVLQVGGSLVEVTASALGSIVLGRLLKIWLPVNRPENNPPANMWPVGVGNRA